MQGKDDSVEADTSPQYCGQQYRLTSKVMRVFVSHNFAFGAVAVLVVALILRRCCNSVVVSYPDMLELVNP